MLGKIEGKRRRGGHRIRWLGGITDVMDMSLSKPWESVMDRETWRAAVIGSQRVGRDCVTKDLHNEKFCCNNHEHSYSNQRYLYLRQFI